MKDGNEPADGWSAGVEESDAWQAPAGPWTIELVGPAGAGKSQLLSALESSPLELELLNRFDKRTNGGMILRNAAPLALRLLRLLTTHAVASFGGLRPGAAAASRASLRAGIHGLLFLHLMRPRVFRRRQSLSAVVVDEGPVFMLAKLEGLRRDHGFPAHFGPAVLREQDYWGSALHAVVLLDAPDEVLMERIRTRAKDHIVKHATEAEMRTFLNDWRTSIAAVCARLAGAFGTRVVRYDSSTWSAEAIKDDLLRRMGLVAPAAASEESA
ncbi:hypothetical protein BH23GEM6_BH23GEM6_21420 [soil metagenome]